MVASSSTPSWYFWSIYLFAFWRTLGLALVISVRISFFASSIYNCDIFLADCSNSSLVFSIAFLIFLSDISVLDWICSFTVSWIYSILKFGKSILGLPTSLYTFSLPTFFTPSVTIRNSMNPHTCASCPACVHTSPSSLQLSTPQSAAQP